MMSVEEVDQDASIAGVFQPMSPGEQETLIEQTRAVAGDGHLELYKTTQCYDSGYHRNQHHFSVP